VDQEFSSSCLSQGGAPIFGDFAKGARDLPGESAVIFEPNCMPSSGELQEHHCLSKASGQEGP
jgi:hypothetical protein